MFAVPRLVASLCSFDIATRFHRSYRFYLEILFQVPHLVKHFCTPILFSGFHIFISHTCTRSLRSAGFCMSEPKGGFSVRQEVAGRSPIMGIERMILLICVISTRGRSPRPDPRPSARIHQINTQALSFLQFRRVLLPRYSS